MKNLCLFFSLIYFLIFFLQIKFCTLEKGKLNLKRNHLYYYQVQGQLNIAKKESCLFVIWTPFGFIYEEIQRDEKFWDEIKPKLKRFYMDCLLPEILDPRVPRGLKIKDPQYILDAKENALKKKSESSQEKKKPAKKSTTGRRKVSKEKKKQPKRLEEKKEKEITTKRKRLNEEEKKEPEESRTKRKRMDEEEIKEPKQSKREKKPDKPKTTTQKKVKVRKKEESNNLKDKKGAGAVSVSVSNRKRKSVPEEEKIMLPNKKRRKQ